MPTFKSPTVGAVCARTAWRPRTITVPAASLLARLVARLPRVAPPALLGVPSTALRLLAPLLAALLLAALAGCPSGSRPRPGVEAGTVQPSPHAAAAPSVMPHVGRPYDLVPGESLITILAYRAGALAKAGHNHVIASHDLSGTIYVPDDLMRTSLQVRIPVDGLTIDETSLRAKEGPDFSAEVPDSAKEGTRHNMLGDALLSAAGNPEILLESERLEARAAGPETGDAASDGSSAKRGSLTAHLRVTVRKAPHSIVVPVHYELQAPDRVSVSGEVAIKQSDLGLTPFSAMLGALQVQDEIKVKFQLSARAAAR